MFDFLKDKKTPPKLPEGTVRRHYRIYGMVQGVGFRYRAQYAAKTLYLTGWIRNKEDGSVEMELQGPKDKFPELFAMVQQSDWIHITDMKTHEIDPDPWERRFSVRDYE